MLVHAVKADRLDLFEGENGEICLKNESIRIKGLGMSYRYWRVGEE